MVEIRSLELSGSVKRVNQVVSVNSNDREDEKYTVVIKGEVYDAERDQEFEFQLTIKSSEPIEGFSPKQQFRVLVQPVDRQLNFEELREAARDATHKACKIGNKVISLTVIAAMVVLMVSTILYLVQEFNLLPLWAKFFIVGCVLVVMLGCFVTLWEVYEELRNSGDA